MTKKLQVGLIFGGNSSEYEVSIVSGRNIYKAIDKDKFDVHPIWITNEGYFANEEESFKVLDDPSYQVKNPHKVNNISNLIELENLPEIDVFFPIVHGNLGEDGVLQGLFRLMDKPFVGDDVLGAAVTMDKEFTKILAQRVGVPVADWISIKRFEYDDKKNAKLNYEKVAEKLGRDMFVKPSNQGSCSSMVLPSRKAVGSSAICPLAERSSSGRNISVTSLRKDSCLPPCRKTLSASARFSLSLTASGNWWIFRQS